MHESSPNEAPPDNSDGLAVPAPLPVDRPPRPGTVYLVDGEEVVFKRDGSPLYVDRVAMPPRAPSRHDVEVTTIGGVACKIWNGPPVG